MFSKCPTAIVLFLALTPPALPQASALSTTGVSSTGWAHAAGSRFLFLQPEDGVDRNGDGDGIDLVWAQVDPTGVVTSLGIASTVGPKQLAKTVSAMTVSEDAQGQTDLNGDGDAADHVLFVLDHATGTLTNTGFAPIFLFPLPPDEAIVPFLVPESLLGADVNGDGDLEEYVIHVHDVATQTAQSTGVAMFHNYATPFLRAMNGRRIVYAEGEENTLVDLNGDGDLNDLVAHALDVSSGAVTNLGLWTTDIGLAGGGDLAVIGVSEIGAGLGDLNGDGDTLDTVLHVYSGPTQVVKNMKVAGGPVSSPEDLVVVVSVLEESQGHSDLNGDGDAVDWAVFLLDPVQLSLTNVGVTGQNFFQPDGPLPPTRIVFLQSEAMASGPNGPVDLNGDGDIEDHVASVLAPATLTTLPLGLANGASHPRIVGDHVLMFVSEADQGGTDLNGDGDTKDSVFTTFDLVTGEVVSAPYASKSPVLRISDTHAVFLVDEVEQMHDLDGDGDALDLVYFAHDVDHGTLYRSPIGVTVGTAAIVAGAGSWLFGAHETDFGVDATGDGDVADHVQVLYQPAPGACGDFLVYGAPCADSGGHAARLDGTGCPNPSGHVDLRVRGGTPGESAFLFVGPQQTFVPLPGGCTLLAGAPLLLAGPLPLVTQGLDSGGLLLHAPLPPTVVAATAYVQAFLTSSTHPWGYTSTNGLRITTSAIP